MDDFAVGRVGRNGEVTYGDDSSCWVEFRMEPQLVPIATEEQGRPIYEDVPFIRMQFPGDKTKIVDRPVKEDDKFRFPQQWENFRKTGENVSSGTPLKEWPILTRSQIQELSTFGIHTVEQLAATVDSNMNFLGARELISKAKLWLDKAKGGAEVEKVAAENAALKADLAAMKEQIKELGKRKSSKSDAE